MTGHPLPPRPAPFASEKGAASLHLPDGPPSRVWRLIDRLVLAGVLLGLLVPGAMLAAGFEARPVENRPLAELPELTLDGVVDASWFQGVDRWFADNIAVRRYAIRLRGEAYLATGSTGTPQVILGRDGWLFARSSFAPQCRNTGEAMASTLRAGAAALEALGITFRFLGLPDKQSVYPDRVGAHPFPPSCADEGRAALRAGIAALGAGGLDGWSIMEAARADDPSKLLYYPSDTHWTPYGALQALRPLISSIDPGAWDEAEVMVGGGRPRRTDLAELVGIRRLERTLGVRLRPGVRYERADLPVDVELRNAPSVVTTQVTGDVPVVRGRTLILCDSYFRIDVPMIAPYFEHATWVHVGDLQHHPELARELAAKVGPFDTVILERVERFLYGDDLDALFDGLAEM